MMGFYIIPGAGGREPRNFAGMLAWMYLQYAKKHGFNSEKLKHETGVHRLVRISPHDPKLRRHTSFVLVCMDSNNDMWDRPIRSYVFDPYRMAKDYRTDKEHPDPQYILEGNFGFFHTEKED